MASYCCCRFVPKSSRNFAWMSFASSCFSLGFVGEEQVRKGWGLVGCPWLCPVSFQALLQVIKGMKGKDRRAGCWPGLRVCPAIIPSGKEGRFYWSSYFRARSFPLGLWWRQLWGSILCFTGLLGWGRQGLFHSICYSNFRAVLIPRLELGWGFALQADARGYDGFAPSCCLLSGSNPFVPWDTAANIAKLIFQLSVLCRCSH